MDINLRSTKTGTGGGSSSLQPVSRLVSDQQTLHSRLMDIKQTLNAELASQPKSTNQIPCKFKRSSMCLNQHNNQYMNTVEEKGNISSIFNRRQSSNGDCSAERLKIGFSNEKGSSALSFISQPRNAQIQGQAKTSISFQQELDAFNNQSKMSNYDTIATPVLNQNPFKTSALNSDVSLSQFENSESKRIAQSKVLLRAAKSITKTKSISGNFIVKTTVTRTPVKSKD